MGSAKEEAVLSSHEDGDITTEKNVPFPAEGMKPTPANWNSEGRADPRGISYLYLATNRDTAIGEVRPWRGALVSVAEFRIRKDLKIVDCGKFHAIEKFTPGGDMSSDEAMWLTIDRAFAKPVGRGDDVAEYIPTQILAEFFKVNGYDGIGYKSVVRRDGVNVALFDPDNAELASCALVKVSGIKYEFENVEPA